MTLYIPAKGPSCHFHSLANIYSYNSTINQQQERSSSRHPNRRTELQHREYECPKAFGNKRDNSKTLIVFLKIPTLLEAEAAAALSCFSKVIFESRMTQKIYYIKCIFHINTNLNYFKLIFIIYVWIKIIHTTLV